jgi:hypothetical protein
MNRIIKFFDLKWLFFYLTATFIFTGCESLVNDLDEGKLPQTQAKITVECFLSPQSTYIEVNVSESQPLFGSSAGYPRILPNAEVILSGENGSIIVPFVDSLNIYQVDSRKFTIEAGKTYHLLINDNGRSVTSVCTIPMHEPVVKSYSIDSISNAHGDMWVTNNIRISWDDIKDVANFYNVRGYALLAETQLLYDHTTNLSSPHRISQIITLDNGYLRNQISDKNLDGFTFESPTYKIHTPPPYLIEYKDEDGNLQTTNSDPELKQIHFEILNVDEHYYQYHRSLNAASNNDNPFTEPALIYTNIEGGLGCFGAFNTGKLTVFP